MKKTLHKHLSFTLILAMMVAQIGCKTSNAVKGGAIGAGTGAVIGGLIGGKKNAALGAIIGAAVGGSAGLLIGRYMDKQAKEIEEELDGAKVERVGEGILITFDSGLLFDYNSSTVKGATKTNLADLANTMNNYPETNILLTGHTDSKGSPEYNQKLSEQRAQSVFSYLKSKGVDETRLASMGFGEEQPVADNETETGRSSNRRVEIAIYANDQLKKDAKKGKIEGFEDID
ncbi:MAG: OmpA family protein [Bacteroidota bacterium]